MRAQAQHEAGPAVAWTSAQLTVVTPVSPSLRDVAYDAIKHRIITCVFKPGDYLNEAYVSATLGIGRTPVHQAIDRLTQEDCSRSFRARA